MDLRRMQRAARTAIYLLLALRERARRHLSRCRTNTDTNSRKIRAPVQPAFHGQDKAPVARYQPAPYND